MNVTLSGTMKRIALGLILFFFISFAVLVGWFFQFTGSVAEGNKSQGIAVIIPKGSTVQEINTILANQKLVAKDIRFLLLARYLGIATRLQAGEFELHRGQTAEELLFELSSAKPIQHSVTIPEGLVIDEIATIFAKGGWCDRDTYIRLAHDSVFIKHLGLGQLRSLEGYLYPDTYYLTRKGHDAADLIRMQVRHYFAVWNTLKEGKETELSPYEVLILASMVEKEAGRAAERPVIAGVFLNRLKKGMRLQSDPTVMYGIENFSGPITKTNLRTPTPYNTYTIAGLPVAPICNPGKGALHAVLAPVKTDFLYFVSKGRGQHQFSKTLKEHNRAVYKYLRAPRKKK